jgi:hypothetical protein
MSLSTSSSLARVGEEGANVIGRRGQAGEVEVDPAEELGIGAEARGLDLHALPLGGDQLIDLAEGRGLLPGEAGAVSHDRQGRGGIGTLEPGEDRRLAAAQRGHQAGAVGRDDLGIAALDERLAAHVAHLAVGVRGQHADLLPQADLLDDRVGRCQLDLGDPGSVGLEHRAVGDPATEGLIVGLARMHDLSADVGHGGRRLEQHHAVIGRGHVDPAGGLVVGQGTDVEDRVVAAERELEPVLALRRAVAGTRVAAEAGHDRVDVVHEVDLRLVVHAGDRDGHLNLQAGE